MKWECPLQQRMKTKEIFYPDGSPVNNYSRTYSDSWMTIRQAIRSSINTVAVQCLEDVTPELGLKYLDNFGFTTLAHGETDENGNVYTDANLSTALGGITSDYYKCRALCSLRFHCKRRKLY